MHLHFWRYLHFWWCLHFWGILHFWGCLHFWGHLYFRCHLHFSGCLLFLGSLNFIGCSCSKLAIPKAYFRINSHYISIHLCQSYYFKLTVFACPPTCPLTYQPPCKPACPPACPPAWPPTLGRVEHRKCWRITKPQVDPIDAHKNKSVRFKGVLCLKRHWKMPK